MVIAGMMSHNDIINAVDRGEMCIVPDFHMPETIDPKKEPGVSEEIKYKGLTPAGFNFSFTRFIISLNDKKMIEIREKRRGKDGSSEIYFELNGGDTALALTRESIWVSGGIAGTFHSKVSYVAQGLGHISTTLDPGWQGQLLISINNPSTEIQKVVIGTRKNKDSEIEYASFITLCLYRLCTPASCNSDNVDARFDIIRKVLESGGKSNNEDDKKRLREVNKIYDEVMVFHKSGGFGDSCKPVKEVGQLKKFSDFHSKILKLIEAISPKPIPDSESSNER